MTVRFNLPDVGEGLEEAEVLEWLVAPGDVVARDQPLVEILTDKSQTQLPSPTAGTVVQLGAEPGDRVSVGALLVELDDATTLTTRRPKASPAVRRRARELGVDLTTVTGSGDGGRILRSDVEREPTTPPPTTSPPASRAAVAEGLAHAPTVPSSGVHRLRGIRRVTSESMTQAWSQVPHIHGHDEVDATALLAARERIAEVAGRTTLLPLLALAVARTLAHHPMLNASIDAEGGTYTIHDGVHLGVAVATDAGLVVPVVRDAHARSLRDLGAELTRLVGAARDRAVTVEELRGATATLTNFGSHGGRFATPIIRPPESAIVGFGAVRERPVAVHGEVVARPTIPVSIGVDHRLVDGDAMTAFQEELLSVLRDPVLLLLDG